MNKRTKIPKSTETDLLQCSRRRCCICVALEGDAGVQQGQIAHLDHNPSNNNMSNLAFLCLRHHDQYDSRSQQSKGLTEPEVKRYREELYEKLPSLLDEERELVTSAGGGVVPDGKEYQIYSELWQRLVDFRIAAHNLVDWLQDRVHEDPQGEFIDALNAYLTVVRSNEPFIISHVFEPARAIVSHGRTIDAATRRLEELAKRRDTCRDWQADEEIAEKMIETDKEQQEAVKEIDRLFDEVKGAIQSRTMPKSPPG